MIINFIPAMGAEERDMQLWAYIDKQCSDAEMQRIAALIAADKSWEAQYNELLAFHKEISTAEPEQPSMRFTRNVMDAIGATQVAPATKSYVNLWVVRGVAAMFALLLIGAVIYMLRDIDWTSHSTSPLPGIARKIDMSNWWTVILAVNVVLLILFIEAILRRRSEPRLKDKS